MTLPSAVVLALSALALAACACGDESTNDPPAAEAVTFSRSGGIAGIGELLKVDLTGSATLVVGYGPTREVERFEVSADELDRIFAAIDEAGGVAELDEGIDTGCADCFLYELAYGEEQATADSVTASGEFAQATAPLQELIEQHRPAGSGVKAG